MQRKFLTNLGLLLFLNLLIKPVWIFGIDLTVQRSVGVTDYGFYSVILNFSFLFNILLDLGITNFNNRNIAQNNHLLNKHFPGLLVLKLLLGFVYILIMFAVALILKYSDEQLKLLGWLAFNQFLLSFILYLRSNISGFLMFRTDSMLSVLDRLLMIFFCGILLWGGITSAPFRIEWFVYSQTAAYSITALVAFLVVVKKAKFRKLNWNWPFFLMIMKQSAPFALLVLLMTFYNRLDPVMMESLLPDKVGNEQAGIYALGFRLLDAANMVAYLFAVLLVPIFSRMLKEKQPVEHMVKLSFTLIISIASIVSIGLFFYSREVMDLLYNSHLDEATSVFRLLIPGFIAVSAVNIFGTLLTANGNFTQLNLIALSGLTINFVLNYFLIPVYLATGSAIASLITQFTMAIVQVIVVQRIFKFKVNVRYISTLVVFVAGVIVFNYLAKLYPVQWSFLPSAYTWLGSFSAVLILSVFFASILKLWSFKSLVKILRQDR
jgi:O-antigen/teichoic acid export membrane protein